MRHWFALSFQLLVVLLISLPAANAATVRVANESLYGIHQQAEVLREAPLRWVFADIQAAAENGLIQPFRGMATSSDREHAVWLKLELAAADSFDFNEPRRYLISHAISQRHADFYVLQNGQ